MNWAQNARFWITMPKQSLFLFLAGVFCIFASFGFIVTGMDPYALNSRLTLLWAFVSGLLSAGWAFFGTRRMLKSMGILAVAQFLIYNGLARLLDKNNIADVKGLHHKFQFCGTGALIMVVAGYVLFTMFFRAEGIRFFAAHTEVRLASEIHRRLVPEFSFRRGNFEFYGASQPSGEVGGDLVDVVEENGAWFGYVADVSGHGVAAGVLMAMVKSAAHMSLRSGAWANLLTELNDVLKPLIAPNMFVTFGCLISRNGGELSFSLAGHPPLLQYGSRAGVVVEHSVENFPLGLFAGKKFEQGAVSAEPGDIFVILTDGLPETVNARDEDLGLAPLKEILSVNHHRPLNEIFAAMRAYAARHGKQADDQSVLLVRVCESCEPSEREHQTGSLSV
jgi:hypothetical protein